MAARLLVAVWLILALPAIALACLWDSDTLRHEAKGLPGVAEIIVGRFDRYPPEYYAARLARVTSLLETDPSVLEAYDDAGVACDRLGRFAEAVQWMARKKARLDTLDTSTAPAKDHLYRYHANLGTFLAHRWINAGADRANLADLQAGRGHIAEAIRINPDAHFGRERYQLLALDWLLEPNHSPMHALTDPLDALPEERRLDRRDVPRDELNDAVEGLTGLMVLGDAWQSLESFHALARVLEHRGDASLALLASLRCQELVAQGVHPIHPANAAHTAVSEEDSFGFGTQVYETPASEIRAFYSKARDAAQLWRMQREGFIRTRIAQGRHPDTDPTFWDGVPDPPLPPFPDPLILDNTTRVNLAASAVIATGTVGGLTALAAYLALRNRRQAHAVRSASTSPRLDRSFGLTPAPPLPPESPRRS